MSKTIDEKVVEMRFDNRHFQKNTEETMSTLDKLKQKLNLTGASKGLENINNTANKVNMSGMSNAIDGVHAKFSSLQVIGVTALANITNSAVNAGKRIAKALTIEPIMTGFSEYETQINAVQTILANTESKGTTLQEVNRALDELNLYADKTIYNFTEMTKNIGTFTAAGVDLKTSVSAIQGIANLAAVSGSTSQQASTAMYQLSQALSAGTVKLMDWNSVVNAGMGGQVFQDALKETARVHGVNIDAMIKKEGSFRNTLQNGWLTSEILTKTLEKFTMAAEEGSEQWKAYKKSLMDEGYSSKQAEEILKMANTATDAATKVKTFTQLWATLKESAQSGWTQTWEIIVGDFGEAKEFLTTISDTIGSMLSESADARNKLLSGGLSSGWKQLLDAGIADEAGYKESIQKVAKKNGFEFEKLIKETEKNGGTFEDALKKALSDGKINSDMLTESVGDLAKKMEGMSAKEREAAGYTEEHVQQIKELNKGLKDGSISMDEFVKKIMRPSGRENLIEALSNSFKALMDIFKPIKEAFREVFPATTGEQLYNITVSIKEMTARFAEFTEKYGPQIKSTFKGLFSILDIGITIIKEVIGGLINLLGNILGVTGGILGVTAALGDWISRVRDSIKQSDIFGRVINGIVEFLQKGIDAIKEFGKYIGEKFAMPGYEGFFGILKRIWDMVINVTKTIKDALVGSLRSGDLKSALDIFNTGLFSGLLVGLNRFIFNLSGSFGNIREILDGLGDVLKAYQQDLQAKALIKIAGAIALLTTSLWVLASIDPSKLKSAIGALTIVFIELLASFGLLTKLSANMKHAFRASIALVSLSTAMLLLAAAIKIMSTMSWDELKIGLLGMVAGLAALVIAVRLLPKSTVFKSAGLISMALSLVILGGALKIMATIGWDEIKRSLVTMGIALAELVLAINLLPKSSFFKTAGLMSAALSLVVIGGALKILATIGWDEIKRSLVTMGIALAELVLAINLLPKSTAIKAVGMIGATMSLIILGGALKILASMDWYEIENALKAMGIALLELVIATNLMKGALLGSASLLVAASSIIVLAMALKVLGSMSVNSMIIALVGLAAAFILIGIAGYALAPIVPTLLGLAGAFALFGAGALAIGVGLGLIAAGITALALALTAGTTAIVAGLSAIILGILDLIPDIVKALGTAIMILCQVLVEAAPLIADTILVILSEILDSLVKHTPTIVASLFEFLIGVIDALGNYIPKLIVSVMDFIGKLFQGIINAFKSIDPSNLLKGVASLGILTALVYALSGITALIPGAMIGVLGLGVLIAELALVLAAIGGLAQIPGLTWLVEQGGNFLQAVGTAIGQFIGGIVGGITQGATASLPQIGKNLSNFMTNLLPFIAGVKLIDSSTLQSVGSLVAVILALTAANVLEGIASWLTGESSISSWASQLPLLGAGLLAFSDSISGMDASVVAQAAMAAKALAEMTAYIPNEGGVAAWFAGENSIAAWAKDLPILGAGLLAFSDSIVGINIEAVKGAAVAAKAVAEMTTCIPNQGGAAAWFAGENSIAVWATELVVLGAGLSAFSDAVIGLDIAAVSAATTAAKSLAEMTSCIPNENGVVSWFTGDNSVGTWASQLPVLGLGLRMFSIAVAGMDANAVVLGVLAAKALVDMTSSIPNEGGVAAWFTGDNSVGTWSSQLPILGANLKAFGDSLQGVNAETLLVAVVAAKMLADMTSTIPNEGGIKSWFTGDSGVGTWSSQLPVLGTGLRLFSIAVSGMDINSVLLGVLAAKALADMTSIIPNQGGIAAWFTGESNVALWSGRLVLLGIGLKKFASEVAGLDTSAISTASKSVKSVSKMIETIPENTGHLDSFGSNIINIAKKLKTFVQQIGDVGSDSIASSISKIKELINMAKTIANTNIESLDTFSDSLKKVAQDGVKGFVNEFSGEAPKAKATRAVQAMITACIKGAESKKSTVKDKFKTIAQAAADALGDSSIKDDAKQAGKDLVQGFVNGINNNKSLATNAGSSLGKAALRAAKAALDEHSPSKEMYKVGDFAGIGFVNALYDNASNAYSAGSEVANSAKNGLSRAISKVTDLLDSDMDTQPMIRPVLDLSDVESGVGYLNTMFNNGPSIGVMSNLNAISAGMNARVQNGVNNDVVSAINKLRKDLGNTGGDTYNINGITYDDGSNITEAVSALIRAAKIERRM